MPRSRYVLLALVLVLVGLLVMLGLRFLEDPSPTASGFTARSVPRTPESEVTFDAPVAPPGPTENDTESVGEIPKPDPREVDEIDLIDQISAHVQRGLEAEPDYATLLGEVLEAATLLTSQARITPASFHASGDEKKDPGKRRTFQYQYRFEDEKGREVAYGTSSSMVETGAGPDRSLTVYSISLECSGLRDVYWDDSGTKTPIRQFEVRLPCSGFDQARVDEPHFKFWSSPPHEVYAEISQLDALPRPQGIRASEAYPDEWARIVQGLTGALVVSLNWQSGTLRTGRVKMVRPNQYGPSYGPPSPLSPEDLELVQQAARRLQTATKQRLQRVLGAIPTRSATNQEPRDR